MLKENFFNTILENQRYCNELRCAKDGKRVFKMTCAFAALAVVQ
jgi:hypothetical protein